MEIRVNTTNTMPAAASEEPPMDAQHFDALTRCFGMAPSRRQLVRLLLGGIGRSALRPATMAAVSAGAGCPHPVVAQAAPCKIRTITVWLNAFIPGDVPGITYTVLDGPFLGKTMIYNPMPGGDCFIGDQRTFSPDLAASSRMHSEITIDVESGTIAGGGMGKQRIGETVEVDCEDGAVECRVTGSTARMHFSKFTVTDDGGRSIFRINLKAAGADACFEITPGPLLCDIDYYGMFGITMSPARDEATVSFAGWIDHIPAYEAYAVADDGPAQALLREMPAPGTGPLSLCLRSRLVMGETVVRCSQSRVGLGGRYEGAVAVADAQVAARLTYPPGDFTELHDLNVAIDVDPTTHAVLGGSLSYEAVAPAARHVYTASTAEGIGPFVELAGGILGKMVFHGTNSIYPTDGSVLGPFEEDQVFLYASDPVGQVVLCANDNSWDTLKLELETQRQACLARALIELQRVS
jgi:hypothetical protein